MENSSKINSKKIMNFVGFIGIIVALYFGYHYWNTPSDQVTTPVSNNGLSVQVVGTETSAVPGSDRHIQSGSISEQFLAQLDLLSNVSFASSIFTDPVFRNRLEDFNKPIPEKAVGRVNPFAPISAAERAAKPSIVTDVSLVVDAPDPIPAPVATTTAPMTNL